jgi:hypothetical protein
MIEELKKFKGKKISYVWRGYGSAIFLEIGKLTTEPNRNHPQGELSVMLEGSWRIEKIRSIYFGSWSSDKKIDNSLKKLLSLNILDISIEGRLPELSLKLENNLWLKSFQTAEGQPEWCIFIDDYAIYVKRGKIIKKKQN